MKRIDQIARAIGGAALWTACIALAVALMPMPRAFAQARPPMPAEELPTGSEVLTRGPVHEAYAEPVTLEPEQGVIAPKPPPAPIQEVPPGERPVGPNVVWIPGYWAWDADRADYIWVSGCWRVPPPGLCWIPGYWAPIAGGWQWVAGLWSTLCGADEQEIEYMPAPPAAIDVEPPGPAPSVNVVWVPGCWYWDAGHYVPRHGYWLTCQTDWVWAPSHYVWTPRGYLFAAGHWDYDLDRRGMLMAPVYFPPSVTVNIGFRFVPSICVDLGALRVSLFTYPRYSHFYFGDFYDDAYVRIGIFPRFDVDRRRSWYDPIFVHDRWRAERANPRWEDAERREYDARRADVNRRPARTFTEMNARLARAPETEHSTMRTVEPLKTFESRHETPIRFETVNPSDRARIAEQSKAVHEFRNQRGRWEDAPAVTTPSPVRRSEPIVRPRQTPEPPKPVVTTPPTERRPETVVRPRETPEPPRPIVTTPPTERRPETPRIAPPPEARPRVEPPPVRVIQPERVKVPPPPVYSRPAEPGPGRIQPTPPPEENRRGGDGRDGGRRDGR